jgi:hypothetical protein
MSVVNLLQVFQILYVVPGPENADSDEPRGQPDMTSCLRSSCKLYSIDVVPGIENADSDEPRGHPDMTSCLMSCCKLYSIYVVSGPEHADSDEPRGHAGCDVMPAIIL